ncbi:MAG: UDP-2,4-diacetamido-2,4,6-trideoxy-beta-L-altropyranose hydrolase, partial [Ruminiclostridium sp.]|nr:UDP-2,4-diacetamido-2,4,6-trideoxy-beta-L-altropyranose hydrolase [Ruminiclostridium sp.]
MKNIAIRCDGNEQIGMGHVMRCLSLAAELAEQGVNVTFFSRFREGIKKIRSLGFKTIEMTVDDSDKKSEVTNGNKTPVLLKEA